MAASGRSSKNALRRGAPGRQTPSQLFTELYLGYYAFVLRSLHTLGAPPDAAEDAAQDVFLVAHRRLADFDVRDAPGTWLFAIALRVVSAHRRSWRRRMRLLDRARGVLPEPGRTPFEDTLQTERQNMLRRILDQLPEAQRSVFHLSDLEGMSAPEIAERLGLNLNTVYSRLRTARRAVSERLMQALAL